MGADRLTERELDCVFSLYNKGASVKEISFIIGRSYGGIAKMLRVAFGTCSQSRRRTYESQKVLNGFGKEFVLSRYLLSFLIGVPSRVEEKGRKYVISNGERTKEDFKNRNLRNGFIKNVK